MKQLKRPILYPEGVEELLLRILLMPFLQIPSGHHHAADIIKMQLEELQVDIHFEKVDILSYCYGSLETAISSIYLQWIQNYPELYSKLYYFLSVRDNNIKKRFYIYEWLFLAKVKQFITKTNPDIIFCTHALPSYLIARLKIKNYWSGTVVNVYTDYFVNHLWGKEGIDYHFSPSLHMKKELISRGISSHQVIVTGIPIHPLFRIEKKRSLLNEKFTILISGGNMGAGSISQLIERLNPSGSIYYKVLCGKNEKLFQSIKLLNHINIEAIPYISNKVEMNNLYDHADAIITKPGGITVTECLAKKLPIIVFEALPGQEELNLQYLTSQKLILYLRNWETSDHVERMITDLLKNRLQLEKRMDTFNNCLEQVDVQQVIMNFNEIRDNQLIT